MDSKRRWSASSSIGKRAQTCSSSSLPAWNMLKTIRKRLQGLTLYNMASSGKTPFLKKDEIEQFGFKLIIYPNWLMLSAIHAADCVLKTLREEETIASIAPQVPSFNEFFRFDRNAGCTRVGGALRRAGGGTRCPIEPTG